MSSKVDSATISKITEQEKKITGQANPVKGGPTAQAQKHAGEDLDSQVISDITKGEKLVTDGERIKGGPTSTAQSIFASNNPQSTGASTESPSSGVLDSETISRITAAEKELTGESQPAKGGPTARAQQHAGEPISSSALHDITEGEKMVSGGERVKGGPTSTAQSELAKSRN